MHIKVLYWYSQGQSWVWGKSWNKKYLSGISHINIQGFSGPIIETSLFNPQSMPQKTYARAHTHLHNSSTLNSLSITKVLILTVRVGNPFNKQICQGWWQPGYYPPQGVFVLSIWIKTRQNIPSTSKKKNQPKTPTLCMCQKIDSAVLQF